MFVLLCPQKYWNCSTIKISHKKIQHSGFNIEEDMKIFMIFKKKRNKQNPVIKYHRCPITFSLHVPINLFFTASQ